MLVTPFNIYLLSCLRELYEMKYPDGQFFPSKFVTQ